MNRPSLSALKAQCDRFNAINPVGQTVTVRRDNGELQTTVTTSKAELLSGHTPVIWLKGIRGCYLLDRVTAVDGQATPL